MKAIVAELADLLRGVADGTPPPTDTDLTVLPPPDERSVGVLAFPGQNIIVADVSAEWVRSWMVSEDLSEPFSPQLLTLLGAVTGRAVGNIDSVLVGRAHGRRRGLELTDVTDSDHPRVARARLSRADVHAWACPGGLLVLGRGVAGRWEVAVEVDAARRGFGLGRGLFGAALGLLPEGESVWAQVAPGNAASLRALLASGYRPVGGEVLFEQRAPAPEGEPVEWFTSYLPVEDWQDEPAPVEVAMQSAEPEPHPEPGPAPDPPATDPPAAEPRVAEPRVAEPPATELPAVEPPAAESATAPAVSESAAEEVPFEPVHFRLPPMDIPPRAATPAPAPRSATGVRRPIETQGAPATADELAAAEAQAAAELDADEDTELAERDEPLS